VQVNPNSAFLNIENIYKAKSEAKASEERLRHRDAENEAKKASAEIMAMEMSSMMHEWQAY